MRVSIVIPAYNEELTVPMLRERLTAFADGMPEYDFEIVMVDDHSADRTPELIKAWAGEDRRVRLVRLSRNFGSHAAAAAGMATCSGDAAVLLAADLQDPPELVREMIGKWHAGSDIVWAFRQGREGEKTSTKLFARLFYAMLRRVAFPDLPAQGMDVMLIDRKVIDTCLRIPEKNTNGICLVFWMGFKQSFVPYVKQARAGGKSKWTLAKKIKLAIDSMLSFSIAPIRIMMFVGIAFLLAGLATAVLSVAKFAIVGWPAGQLFLQGGVALLLTVLLAGFGTVMLMLYLLGEYLWRTYDQVRGRPGFIIEEQYPSPQSLLPDANHDAHVALCPGWDSRQ